MLVQSDPRPHDIATASHVSLTSVLRAVCSALMLGHLFYTVRAADCSSAFMQLTVNLCAAEPKWNRKLNRTMWSGYNKCVIGKGCISNSCIDGVSETKQGLCKCPIVMSWNQSLGIHRGVMHTSYAHSLHLRFLVLTYDCNFAYKMLQQTSPHNLQTRAHQRVACKSFQLPTPLSAI